MKGPVVLSRQRPTRPHRSLIDRTKFTTTDLIIINKDFTMTAVPKIIDRLHAVAAPDTAAPESIRYIPNLLNAENLRTLICTLGLDAEFKAAAKLNDYNIDVAVIDRALAKTKLSVQDKIQAKISLLGSGWKGLAF
jgi:hypothetical protein